MSALARHGEFYYPVRLIQRYSADKDSTQILRWQVVWWRECSFTLPPPDERSYIDEDQIVDSLYNDVKGRRQIKVRKWFSFHILLAMTDTQLLSSENGPGASTCVIHETKIAKKCRIPKRCHSHPTFMPFLNLLPPLSLLSYKTQTVSWQTTHQYSIGSAMKEQTQTQTVEQ